MDLPTLVYRRVRGSAIDTYKNLNGNHMVDYTQLLLSHHTRDWRVEGIDGSRHTIMETRGVGWKWRPGGMDGSHHTIEIGD